MHVHLCVHLKCMDECIDLLGIHIIIYRIPSSFLFLPLLPFFLFFTHSSKSIGLILANVNFLKPACKPLSGKIFTNCPHDKILPQIFLHALFHVGSRNSTLKNLLRQFWWPLPRVRVLKVQFATDLCGKLQTCRFLTPNPSPPPYEAPKHEPVTTNGF